MKKRVKAKIFYKVLESHPDYKYIKNPQEEMCFEDVYIFQADHFDNKDQMFEFIKNDLKLVAGGGYDFDHITNVRFEF